MNVQSTTCWERFKACCSCCCNKRRSAHNRGPTRVEDLVEQAVQPVKTTMVQVEPKPPANSLFEFLKNENARITYEKNSNGPQNKQNGRKDEKAQNI